MNTLNFKFLQMLWTLPTFFKNKKKRLKNKKTLKNIKNVTKI